MSRPFWLISVIAGTLAIAGACSESSPSPSAPSAASPAQIDANADGSLLKANAPTPRSPINGQRLTTEQAVTLEISNSVGTYIDEVFSYRFEVLNAAGSVIYTSPDVVGGAGTTSHTLATALAEDQTYQWQARAMSQGVTGPVSSRVSFVIEPPEGYIRGNELYDPLFNGKTVGEINGPVAFVPGEGIRLLTQSSYVSYRLPQTLTKGEISMLVWNITSGTPGVKTKIFSMSQGSGDITTDPRRFTVEKRGGSDAGAVAWRVISNEDQIETIGPERLVLRFLFNTVYYWRATFGRDNRNGDFNLTINEGGVGGPRIYEFGKEYSGLYDPNPHMVYLGAPPTRSGPDSQTVPNMVIRQVWVSSRPRPSFARR